MKFIRNVNWALCLLTLVTGTKAQELEVFANLEGGIPFSSSLKDFHEELANQITIESFETTDNFGYNYGFTVGFRFNQNASVFFNNRVSGAKTSVADFSGFIRLTNELSGYTFGLEYEIMFREFDKSKLNLGIKGLVTPSKLTLTSESNIQNEVQSESLEFNSLDFGGALGLNYEYSLGFFTLRAHLDVNIYLGGKLTLEDDDSGGFLTDQNGDKVTTSWTGLAGGLGILIPLSK